MTEVNLLLEVVHALREISQQLNRLASQLERLHEGSMPSAQTPQTALSIPDTFRPDAQFLTQKLMRFCEARGIDLVEHAPEQPTNAVERERRHLARFMVEHHGLLAPLLELMRGTLASPRTTSRKVAHLDAEQLSIVTNFLTRLYQLYILDYYVYNRSERAVSFRVRKQPFAQNFLSGQWFEMGVAERVKRLLNSHPCVIFRNARFQSAQGGCFEVDILIALWACGEFRLAALECKSAGTLVEEELGQIRRVASVLNLSAARCAVVFPKPLSEAQAKLWFEQTGASMESLQSLSVFLQSLTE